MVSGSALYQSENSNQIPNNTTNDESNQINAGGNPDLLERQDRDVIISSLGSNQLVPEALSSRNYINDASDCEDDKGYKTYSLMPNLPYQQHAYENKV